MRLSLPNRHSPFPVHRLPFTIYGRRPVSMWDTALYGPAFRPPGAVRNEVCPRLALLDPALKPFIAQGHFRSVGGSGNCTLSNHGL